MKKGIILTRGNYPEGSSALRHKMLIKGFRKYGYKVDILVSFPAPTDKRKSLAEYTIFCLSSIKKEQKRNCFALFYKLWGTVLSLGKLLKLNPDFIILSSSDFLLGLIILIYLKINKNCRFYCDKVDENGKMYDSVEKNFIEKIAALNQMYFDKLIMAKVDQLWVISSFLYKKYIERYPNLKIYKSTPTLIDYNYFKLLERNDIAEIGQTGITAFKSDSIKFFYAGAINRNNGLKFFLECYTEVKEKLQFDTKVIIVAAYGDKSPLFDFAKMLGIEDDFVIIEKVDYKYIPAMYRLVDVLILPEQGNIIADAGFPGKTTEYLASGKAILSTIFSDLTDYLKHGYNAMLASVGDKQRYKENINKLIEDKDLRRRIGENAIKTVQERLIYSEGIKFYIEKVEDNENLY